MAIFTDHLDHHKAQVEKKMLPYKCLFAARTIGRCLRSNGSLKLLVASDLSNLFGTSIRKCTTNSASASSSITSTNTSAIDNSSNEIGKFYNSILFAGRKGIPLGLNRLRKLLEMVTEPSHGKFAVLGMNYYHFKGMDFNFEINQKFISACLKTKNINGLLEIFLKYNNRLAAWTTGNNLHVILTEFHTNPANISSDQLIKLFDIVTVKGVQVQESSLDLVLQIISSKNDLTDEVRNNIIAHAKRILKQDVVDALVTKYPPQIKKAVTTPVPEVIDAVTPPSEKK